MPRRVERNYPDVAQLGIGSTPTIVNQSRVTFTGQRGLAFIFWKMGVRKASAGDLALISTGVNANFATANVATGLGFLTGAIGNALGLWAISIVLDPPEGGFIELRAFTTTGTFDLPASDSTVQVISFGDVVGEGPTVQLG